MLVGAELVSKGELSCVGFQRGVCIMLVPKGRDLLIEQMPALKLWPTIKLKRHRPMFVVCTLALKWWQIFND